MKYLEKQMKIFIKVDMLIEINKWRIQLIEHKSFKKKHKICLKNIKI